MPLAFATVGGRFVATAVDDVEFVTGVTEFRTAAESYRDAHPDDGTYVIDIRRSAENRTRNEIRLQATLFRSIMGPGRLAIIVETDLQFGQARMVAAEMAGGPTDVRIFRDAEMAEAWLARSTLRS